MDSDHNLARLELRWRDRTPSGNVIVDGKSAGIRTPRRFLDFVIDGVSCYDVIQSHRYDEVSVFMEFDGNEEWFAEAASRLVGDAAPNSIAHQCAIYVCPECGDLECGFVTVRVTRVGDIVTWSHFAWEHPDYAHGGGMYRPIDELGPYSFEYNRLQSVLVNRPKDSGRK